MAPGSAMGPERSSSEKVPTRSVYVSAISRSPTASRTCTSSIGALIAASRTTPDIFTGIPSASVRNSCRLQPVDAERHLDIVVLVALELHRILHIARAIDAGLHLPGYPTFAERPRADQEDALG